MIFEKHKNNNQACGLRPFLVDADAFQTLLALVRNTDTSPVVTRNSQMRTLWRFGARSPGSRSQSTRSRRSTGGRPRWWARQGRPLWGDRRRHGLRCPLSIIRRVPVHDAFRTARSPGKGLLHSSRHLHRMAQAGRNQGRLN
jgi:hypothetical protein